MIFEKSWCDMLAVFAMLSIDLGSGWLWITYHIGGIHPALRFLSPFFPIMLFRVFFVGKGNK